VLIAVLCYSIEHVCNYDCFQFGHYLKLVWVVFGPNCALRIVRVKQFHGQDAFSVNYATVPKC